jgi:hypothetical protein
MRTALLSLRENRTIRFAGATHVVLELLDFIARLAALVPRPRVNLTRFHSAGESDRTSYA